MAANQKIYFNDNLEVIYDDRFKKSLFNIIYENNIESILHFKNLLDSSGYFGRYDIIQLRRHGGMSDKMKLQIYLPDSIMYYMWPFKTFLILGNYDNLKVVQKKIPPNVFELVKNAYKYNINFEDLYNNFMSSKNRKKYLEFLEEYRILDKKYPIIKTKHDALELASNIVRV